MYVGGVAMCVCIRRGGGVCCVCSCLVREIKRTRASREEGEDIKQRKREVKDEVTYQEKKEQELGGKEDGKIR